MNWNMIISTSCSKGILFCYFRYTNRLCSYTIYKRHIIFTWEKNRILFSSWESFQYFLLAFTGSWLIQLYKFRLWWVLICIPKRTAPRFPCPANQNNQPHTSSTAISKDKWKESSVVVDWSSSSGETGAIADVHTFLLLTLLYFCVIWSTASWKSVLLQW